MLRNCLCARVQQFHNLSVPNHNSNNAKKNVSKTGHSSCTHHDLRVGDDEVDFPRLTIHFQLAQREHISQDGSAHSQSTTSPGHWTISSFCFFFAGFSPPPFFSELMSDRDESTSLWRRFGKTHPAPTRRDGLYFPSRAESWFFSGLVSPNTATDHFEYSTT